MQIDALAAIAELHAENARLRRRVDELLTAMNDGVARRRALKARAVAMCDAMANDSDVPQDARTAGWHLKIGIEAL